jgi:protein gp37
MMASSNTTIEWTDRTWNPLRGCTRVSEGCTNCYAEKIAYRFSGEGQAFEGLARKVGNEARWTGKIMLVEKELETPLRWKKPQRVFVNSVSDLFHEKVPFDFIEQVFETMYHPDGVKHTYQILTKRPKRMLEYFNYFAEKMADFNDGNGPDYGWLKRLPNIWIGTSVEDQKAADERIPYLLQIPAAVRFLSCEPLLGPVDLTDGCGAGAANGTNYQKLYFWVNVAQQINCPDRFNILLKLPDC